jgi:hypothetical protein
MDIHLGALKIQNPSIIGHSQNTNPSITEGLTCQSTMSRSCQLPYPTENQAHYICGMLRP